MTVCPRRLFSAPSEFPCLQPHLDGGLCILTLTLTWRRANGRRSKTTNHAACHLLPAAHSCLASQLIGRLDGPYGPCMTGMPCDAPSQLQLNRDRGLCGREEDVIVKQASQTLFYLLWSGPCMVVRLPFVTCPPVPPQAALPRIPAGSTLDGVSH